MNRFAILLLLAALCLPGIETTAQLKPAVLKKVGTHISDGYPKDCAVLEDGSTLIVGTKQSSTYWTYAFIAWVNPDGSTRKEVIIDGKTEGTCEAFFILPEPGTGCVYVLGETQLWSGKYASTYAGLTYSTDVFLVKYDALGNELWFTTIPYEETDKACGLGFTADGNITVLGVNSNFLRNTDNTYLVTFSPEGERIAGYDLTLPYEEYFSYSYLSPAGDGTFWLLVHGLGKVPGEKNKCFPHLFHITEQGETIAQYLITGVTSYMFDDMKMLSNGTLLLSMLAYGNSGDVPESGAYLFCFDMNCNKLWTRHYSTDSERPHMKVTETPEGDIVAAIFTPEVVPEFASLPRSRTNLYLTKLSSNGEDIWKKSLAALPFYQSPERIDYLNGQIVIALDGCQNPVNNIPPDHQTYYCTVVDPGR